MAVYGVGVSEQDSVTTWADLDKANQQDGHYRRRPDYVVHADHARTAAWDRLNRLINESEDLGYWLPEVESAERLALIADENYRKVIYRWQAEAASALSRTPIYITEAQDVSV